MSVVLKYTLAGRPCERSDPAHRAGDAQGTIVEGEGETEGEGICWEGEKWVERRRWWKVLLDKG